MWELIPATSARLFVTPGVSGRREGRAGCVGGTCLWSSWHVLGQPVQGSAHAGLPWWVSACTCVFSVSRKGEVALGTPLSLSAPGFGNPAGASEGFGWDLPILVATFRAILKGRCLRREGGSCTFDKENDLSGK